MLKLTFAVSSGRKRIYYAKLILKQMVGLEVFKLSKKYKLFQSFISFTKKIHLTRRYYLITEAALLINFPLDYNRSITHLRKVSQCISFKHVL